jgi:hypothetical protein
MRYGAPSRDYEVIFFLGRGRRKPTLSLGLFHLIISQAFQKFEH